MCGRRARWSSTATTPRGGCTATSTSARGRPASGPWGRWVPGSDAGTRPRRGAPICLADHPRTDQEHLRHRLDRRPPDGRRRTLHPHSARRATARRRAPAAIQACGYRRRRRHPRRLRAGRGGVGPALSDLRRRARPTVRFHGRADDATVTALMERCRAVCLPGVEDVGIVPVEAQAAGKPVIAFARGGALETVEDGGDRGVLRPLPRRGCAGRGGALRRARR